MKFFAWLLERRLFIHYLSITIAVVGLLSISNMQREARPNVNFFRVAVSASYPGATPQDIEELVISPIEEKINEVSGIKEYRSVAFKGAGAISIIIDENYPDLQEVADEIRLKVNEVTDLPPDVEPYVLEIKASIFSIMRFALYGSLDDYQLNLEVDKLSDYLKTFPGVQAVNKSGLGQLQMKVLAQPEKLTAYDISLLEVIGSLRSRSRQKPGGLLETQNETVNISIGEDFDSPEKLKNFIIRSNDFGKSIQLSDIATIKYEGESEQKKYLYEDKNAVFLNVTKIPNADIVTTVSKIKEGLVSYKEGLPKELDYKIYYDGSQFVSNRLNVVLQNAFFGMILVIILLICFLDLRSSIVTSLGIPIAILGGMALVYLTGNTMNSLVIIGLIIVLGMLVDDAIVMCENIYSYVEKGMDPSKAAIKGAQEIATPVIATVMTTVLAFFPIIFMKEIIGQFLRVIPITVICLLVVSLFEALFILPVHGAEILSISKRKKASLFAKLEPYYERYLFWSIKRRRRIVIILAAFIVGSIFQGQKLFDKFSLFPARGLNGLDIRVELEENTPMDQTEEAVKKMMRRLKTLDQGYFESLYAELGEVTTGGSSRQTGSHLAEITIRFISESKFYDVEDEIVDKIKETSNQLAKELNLKASVSLDRPGPPSGKPIQLQITSRDFQLTKQIIKEISDEFEKMPGVNSLESDLSGDNKNYRFSIDYDLAVSDQIEPDDISSTIFAATTGRVTHRLLSQGKELDLLVSIEKPEDFKIQSIQDLAVINKSGQATPLRTYTSLSESKGPSSIQRLNGMRTVTLFGEVDEKVISGKEANKKIKPFLDEIKKKHPSITIKAGGREKDRNNAVSDTAKLYLLALLLIFMTISLSFQSVIYPFLVILSIPLGVCGVVWSLVVHGQPLSLMGIIGIVGLSGVVVNVSIILLKFIQEECKQGTSLRDSIVKAGKRRLRPVVITTMTTLIGLLPTIYGVGGIDFFVQPLALVLGWGLFVASVLTIFALPALYSYFTILEKK